MSNEAESGQESTPNQTVPSPPPAPSGSWIWSALITGTALTAAANYLIYSRGPGAGWALFFLLLATGIFINRRHSGRPRRIELALGALLAVSGIQMIIRPSLSNAIVLFTLTLIASAHFLQDSTTETSAARKLIEALRKLLLSPMRWLQASQLVATRWDRSCASHRHQNPQREIPLARAPDHRPSRRPHPPIRDPARQWQQHPRTVHLEPPHRLPR